MCVFGPPDNVFILTGTRKIDESVFPRAFGILNWQLGAFLHRRQIAFLESFSSQIYLLEKPLY